VTSVSWLVDWADIIRKTFYDGGIEEIISTRRLVHIIRAIASLVTRQRQLMFAPLALMMKPNSLSWNSTIKWMLTSKCLLLVLN
jgi:hypothetical protein